MRAGAQQHAAVELVGGADGEQVPFVDALGCWVAARPGFEHPLARSYAAVQKQAGVVVKAYDAGAGRVRMNLGCMWATRSSVGASRAGSAALIARMNGTSKSGTPPRSRAAEARTGMYAVRTRSAGRLRTARSTGLDSCLGVVGGVAVALIRDLTSFRQ